VPVKDLELEKIIKLNEDKEAYINFIEALKSDSTKRLYRNRCLPAQGLTSVVVLSVVGAIAYGYRTRFHPVHTPPICRA